MIFEDRSQKFLNHMMCLFHPRNFKNVTPIYCLVSWDFCLKVTTKVSVTAVFISIHTGELSHRGVDEGGSLRCFYVKSRICSRLPETTSESYMGQPVEPLKMLSVRLGKRRHHHHWIQHLKLAKPVNLCDA